MLHTPPRSGNTNQKREVVDLPQNDFALPFEEAAATVNCFLRVHESFDLLVKRLCVGGRRAAFYFVEGLIKDEMLERMLEFFSALTEKQMNAVPNAKAFLDTFVTSMQAKTEESLPAFATEVLSGAVGMLIEGFDRAVILDGRTYPSRAMKRFCRSMKKVRMILGYFIQSTPSPVPRTHHKSFCTSRTR